jgi:low affinity Fe/Cu permease
MTLTTANEQRHASSLNERFSQFARLAATWCGHPLAFLLALATVFVWAITGPVFGYSAAWQLVINTGTTIITFLMVFVIQNTQNRDMIIMQTKLSELVLSMKGAENKFAALEDLTDEELQRLHDECRVQAQMTSGSLLARQRNRNSVKDEVRDLSDNGS